MQTVTGVRRSFSGAMPPFNIYLVSISVLLPQIQSRKRNADSGAPVKVGASGTKFPAIRRFFRDVPFFSGPLAQCSGSFLIRRSETFVDAVTALKDRMVSPDELDRKALPTLRNTIATTAILEAGRRGRDECRGIEILVETE